MNYQDIADEFGLLEGPEEAVEQARDEGDEDDLGHEGGQGEVEGVIAVPHAAEVGVHVHGHAHDRVLPSPRVVQRRRVAAVVHARHFEPQSYGVAEVRALILRIVVFPILWRRQEDQRLF